MSSSVSDTARYQLDSCFARIEQELSMCSDEWWEDLERLRDEGSESLTLQQMEKLVKETGWASAEDAQDGMRDEVLSIEFGARQVSLEDWPPKIPHTAEIVLCVGGPDIRVRCELCDQGAPRNPTIVCRWWSDCARSHDDSDDTLQSYCELILSGLFDC